MTSSDTWSRQDWEAPPACPPPQGRAAGQGDWLRSSQLKVTQWRRMSRRLSPKSLTSRMGDVTAASPKLTTAERTSNSLMSRPVGLARLPYPIGKSSLRSKSSTQHSSLFSPISGGWETQRRAKTWPVSKLNRFEQMFFSQIKTWSWRQSRVE